MVPYGMYKMVTMCGVCVVRWGRWVVWLPVTCWLLRAVGLVGWG